jgi:hypothetical protein
MEMFAHDLALLEPEAGEDTDLIVTARVEQFIDETPNARKQLADTQGFIKELASHLQVIHRVKHTASPHDHHNMFHGRYRLPVGSFSNESLFLAASYDAFRAFVKEHIISDVKTFAEDYATQAHDVKATYAAAVKALRSEMAFCRARKEKADAECAKRDKAIEKLTDARQRMLKPEQIEKARATAEKHAAAARDLIAEYRTTWAAGEENRDTFIVGARDCLQRFISLELQRLSVIHTAFERYLCAHRDLLSHVQTSIRQMAVAVADPVLEPEDAVADEVAEADEVVAKEEDEQHFHSVRKYFRRSSIIANSYDDAMFASNNPIGAALIEVRRISEETRRSEDAELTQRTLAALDPDEGDKGALARMPTREQAPGAATGPAGAAAAAAAVVAAGAGKGTAKSSKTKTTAEAAAPSLTPASPELVAEAAARSMPAETPEARSVQPESPQQPERKVLRPAVPEPAPGIERAEWLQILKTPSLSLSPRQVPAGTGIGAEDTMSEIDNFFGVE